MTATAGGGGGPTVLHTPESWAAVNQPRVTGCTVIFSHGQQLRWVDGEPTVEVICYDPQHRCPTCNPPSVA